MSGIDGEQFGREVVIAVKEYMAREMLPLLDRIKILEARQPERGEKGEPGAAGMPGPAGPAGPPGESITGGAGPVGPIGPPGPQGLEGKSITGERGEAGPQGPAGIMGTPGERGEPGPIGPEGRTGIGVSGEAGPAGPPGPEGKSITGPPGRDGLPGIPGRDGKDGLGVQDFNIEYDGNKTFTLVWGAGDRLERKTFVIPVNVWRGIWKAGAYLQGDSVTWNGAIWIAQRDTEKKPAGFDGNDDWILAVKRGRDGKAGNGT